MEETPVPDEKKPRFDRQSGKTEPPPSEVEGARLMANETRHDLEEELPLAWPVIVAGIRTAAVVNVGTAALATFVGAGGLGALITVGLDNQRDRILYTGAALTALLALTVDWALAVVAGLTSPRR